MGGAVIGIGASGRQNPAPDSDYEALYNALNGQTERAYVVINGFGETLAPTPNRPWTNVGPNGVSEFVSAGNVWVDYCGWPMFWHVDTAGVMSQYGAAGFQGFAVAIGYNSLSQKQFAVPTFGGESSTGYPFQRGYPEIGTQNGVYLGSGTFVTPPGFLGVGGGSFPIAAGGWTSLMALHRPGIGWYFYGTYDRAANYGVPNAVPVDVYAAFILACLRGQGSWVASAASGLISHAPYQAPTHTVVSPPPSKTPYPTGNTGTGSNSSGNLSVTTTSAPGPSGGHASTASGTATTSGNSTTGGFVPATPAAAGMNPVLEAGLLAVGAGAVVAGLWYLLS
jgi:hypothetical protein